MSDEFDLLKMQIDTVIQLLNLKVNLHLSDTELTDDDLREAVQEIYSKKDLDMISSALSLFYCKLPLLIGNLKSRLPEEESKEVA